MNVPPDFIQPREAGARCNRVSLACALRPPALFPQGRRARMGVGYWPLSTLFLLINRLCRQRAVRSVPNDCITLFRHAPRRIHGRAAALGTTGSGTAPGPGLRFLGRLHAVVRAAPRFLPGGVGCSRRGRSDSPVAPQPLVGPPGRGGPRRGQGLRAGRHRRTLCRRGGPRGAQPGRTPQPAPGPDGHASGRARAVLPVRARRDGAGAAVHAHAPHALPLSRGGRPGAAGRGSRCLPRDPGAPQALGARTARGPHAPLPHLRQRSHPLHRRLPALLQPADPQGSLAALLLLRACGARERLPPRRRSLLPPVQRGAAPHRCGL